MSGDLDPVDAALLAFEEDWQSGRLHGDKAALIRDRLDLSSPRYHRRLNELIDDPVARAQAPSLLGRLDRVRAGRRHDRSADLLP
ncbi:DUF3263 domain-containing protein [Acidipropionibacterium timonense]|uniref:DUF3263 domain-containing protein n=1 Tax=Acidipropionibacterium timonense TaxID=2161818 RepID=UPI001031F563|nr:DUF3263 domain-containing protein [Acidipropionibacterium timonense]